MRDDQDEEGGRGVFVPSARGCKYRVYSLQNI